VADESTNGDPTVAGDAPPQQQVKFNVDDSNVHATYTNFCRVNSTAEELILDIGLNANPATAKEGHVRVDQRVIMNHYTAKRLLAALSMAIQRHEQAFGAIELDVRRRVQASPPPAGGSR